MRTTWLTRLAGTENSGCGFQIIIGNRSSLVCVRVKRVETVVEIDYDVRQ